MRAARRLALTAFTALALSACRPAPPAHDEAFYAANAQARGDEVKACAADAAAASGPDCLAALKADAAAESRRALRYAPPANRLRQPGQL